MAKLSHKLSNQIFIVGLLLGCVLFGLGSLIVAHVEAVGSFAMAFWRLLISGLIFLGLGVAFGQKFIRHTKATILALLAGAALGIDLALWHESIYAVGPGISTLLNGLQIFALAFIGFVCFGERQNKLQLISLAVASCGVLMIASPEFSRNHTALWGFVSGILSGCCLAISMAFIRRTHEVAVMPILPMMSLVGFGGALVLLPLMLIFNPGQWLPTSASDIGSVLVYAIVMQCMAWGLIAYCIPKIALSVTGLALLSEPVLTLVLDYFWLDKVIDTTQWLGAFLVMFAIYLGSVRSR